MVADASPHLLDTSIETEANPLQVLWAPWRMAYIAGRKARRCIFCPGVRVNARKELILARTRNVLIMLNRFPYANGHVMVAPARHAADPSELSEGEYIELSEMLRRSMACLDRVFRPQGMNVGMNLGAAAGAGVADHLHWHIVPRWVGDTNFMPLLAEVRVMPEHLQAVYDRLRPAFAELEGASGGARLARVNRATIAARRRRG